MNHPFSPLAQTIIKYLQDCEGSLATLRRIDNIEALYGGDGGQYALFMERLRTSSRALVSLSQELRRLQTSLTTQPNPANADTLRDTSRPMTRPRVAALPAAPDSTHKSHYNTWGYVVVPDFYRNYAELKNAPLDEDEEDIIFSGPGAERRMASFKNPADVEAKVRPLLEELGIVDSRHVLQSAGRIWNTRAVTVQAAHNDFASCTGPVKPFSVILALQEGTSLVTWPRCSRTGIKRPTTGPGLTVDLQPGDAIIFRGDFDHAGAAYADLNMRVFLSFNVDRKAGGYARVWTVNDDGRPARPKRRTRAVTVTAGPSAKKAPQGSPSATSSASAAVDISDDDTASEEPEPQSLTGLLWQKISDQYDAAVQRYKQSRDEIHNTVKEQSPDVVLQVVGYSIHKTFKSMDDCYNQLVHAHRGDNAARYASGLAYHHIHETLRDQGNTSPSSVDIIKHLKTAGVPTYSESATTEAMAYARLCLTYPLLYWYDFNQGERRMLWRLHIEAKLGTFPAFPDNLPSSPRM